MDLAAIPVCMVGVLFIARPSFIFGGHSQDDSRVGIAVGVAQVKSQWDCTLLDQDNQSCITLTDQCCCHLLSAYLLTCAIRQDVLLQAFFSAAVKVVVRILGKTESVHVMMLYMGGVSFLCAAILCLSLPNMFQMPRSLSEHMFLVLTGELVWMVLTADNTTLIS